MEKPEPIELISIGQCRSRSSRDFRYEKFYRSIAMPTAMQGILFCPMFPVVDSARQALKVDIREL